MRVCERGGGKRDELLHVSQSVYFLVAPSGLESHHLVLRETDEGHFLCGIFRKHLLMGLVCIVVCPQTTSMAASQCGRRTTRK